VQGQHLGGPFQVTLPLRAQGLEAARASPGGAHVRFSEEPSVTSACQLRRAHFHRLGAQQTAIGIPVVVCCRFR
jgi:hypothetical protein